MTYLIVLIVLIVLISLICLYFCQYFFLKSISQTGGSRVDLFNRFNYMPVKPYRSTFSDSGRPDLEYRGKFSKRYNHPGRLKIIMGRPYRNYRMKSGNWGNPWHFPESSNVSCLNLASRRCKEPIDLTKNHIIPSKFVDSVYQQCRGSLPL